jgi:hypothetical protein
MPKDIVSKWISEVMTYTYDITIHPKDAPFGDKFLRILQREGWVFSLIEGHKIVVVSNDPLKLAGLSLRLKGRGYLIED